MADTDSKKKLNYTAASINEALAAVPTKAEETDLAPLFDETKEYTYGDLVTYDGELWMCHAATGHTGEWVEDDFVQKSLADILPSYCRKDGLYPNLTAGLAQGLVGTGTPLVEDVLSYDFSGSTELSKYQSGAPSMSILGRSYAWREMCDNNTAESEGGHLGTKGPAIGGTYYYGTSSSQTAVKPYLIHCITGVEEDGSTMKWEWIVSLIGEEKTLIVALAEFVDSAGNVLNTAVVADSADTMGHKVVDLVLAFGVTDTKININDNTGLTADETLEKRLLAVAQMWGSAKWTDFVAATDNFANLMAFRSQGELVSTKIPATLKAYKDGEVVAEREVPEEVLRAFPDGLLRSDGSVCDEISETECVKRMAEIIIKDCDISLVSTNKNLIFYVQTPINVVGSKDWNKTLPLLLHSMDYKIECWNKIATDTSVEKAITVPPAGNIIVIRDSRYNTVDEFKESLTGSEKVVAQLATPIVTELSTPLSLSVLDSDTLLKYEPKDTTLPLAPARLSMQVNKDYAAMIEKLWDTVKPE